MDYRILIYTHDNTQTTIPNKNDAHIAIDMSFKVGGDSNGNVVELDREKQSLEQKTIYTQTSINNLKAGNTLQCICNVKEAVDFLRANKHKLNELVQNNKARYAQKDSNNNPIHNVLLDYFRIHPSLAGKIAYIYYRFDMTDDRFVESVNQTCYMWFNCTDEYVADREEFVRSIVSLFDEKQADFKNKNFLQKYKEIFYTNNPNNVIAKTDEVEQRKHFIEYLLFKIIEIFRLSYPANFTLNKDIKNPYKDIVVFSLEDINKNPNGTKSLHNSYVKNQTIHFNTLALEKGNFIFTSNDKYYPFRHIITFEHISNTIFHEIRHFYAAKKYIENDSSILKRYIYWSRYFYIDTSMHPVIFDKFNKSCIYSDVNNVGCIPNNNQSAYQIQPNERDPRYMANQIVKELKKKGL